MSKDLNSVVFSVVTGLALVMSETLYGVVLLVVGLVLILCGVVVYVLTESWGVSWGLMGSGLAIVWLVAISWLRHVMKK